MGVDGSSSSAIPLMPSALGSKPVLGSDVVGDVAEGSRRGEEGQSVQL